MAKILNTTWTNKNSSTPMKGLGRCKVTVTETFDAYRYCIKDISSDGEAVISRYFLRKHFKMLGL